MSPIPITAPRKPPGETAEQELTRLRRCRTLLEETLTRTGHIGCADVAAILAATKAPGT